MSRPEDIPQDVWDAAEKCNGADLAFMRGEVADAVSERIALAILAAKAEERALCAMTVHLLTSEDLPDEFIGRPATFGDALDLAEAAIRKRGEG